MKKEIPKSTFIGLVVGILLVVAVAGYFVYSNAGGGAVDTQALMPKTGQAPPVAPSDMKGLPEGVLAGGGKR